MRDEGGVFLGEGRRAGVQDLRFRVLGVQGFWFRVQGSGFSFEVSESMVEGLWG